MPETTPPAETHGRRDFLKKTGLVAGFMLAPSYVVGQSPTERPPSSRLNIAIVGVGGRGSTAVFALRDENIVAFCDVDQNRVEERIDRNDGAEFRAILEIAEKKGVRWFEDYREMFVEMENAIDAVVISTPDHMHFPIAMSALRRKIHVFCEKPLTHTIEEARLLTEATKQAGVVTQMGNQGRSAEGFQLTREWVAAGLVGPIREVHAWTNRPVWPQGLKPPDHSEAIPVVPRGMNWDLWLGTSLPRAYDPAYAPFGWRGWWDFGTGALGDMACHVMDAAWTALELGYPEWVEATSSGLTPYSPPNASVVTYSFPAKGDRPALRFHWYDGGMLPAIPPMLDALPEAKSVGASLLIGDEACLSVSSHSQQVRMLPRDQFLEVRRSLPPKSLPRYKGTHYDEFLNAIREGRKANSDFSISGVFTEVVLLSALALRTQRRIAFDPASMSTPHFPGADRYLRQEGRGGWIV